MLKNTRVIVLLTLATIVFWVVYQVLKTYNSSTIDRPTQELMNELDPDLDERVFDDLEQITN